MNLTSTLAIICITALAIIALALGFNGALLASSFAIIGGLGGYEAKRARDKRKGTAQQPDHKPFPK